MDRHQHQTTCDKSHSLPHPLDVSRIRERLQELEGWQIENAYLVKSYHFEQPIDAMAFVARVGAAAQERNHHPHVHWWKRDVHIKLWTHKSNGLTSHDFDFAACCDPLCEVKP